MTFDTSDSDEEGQSSTSVTATVIAVPVHDSTTTETEPHLPLDEDIGNGDGLIVVDNDRMMMARSSLVTGRGGGAEYTPIEGGGGIPGSSSPSSSLRCCDYSSCCWTFLKFLSHFAVAILAGVTIFLFLQVQYLTVMVKQEQVQINQLSSQLANQTQGQIQELTDKVNQEHSLTLYQMAGTFALLACLLTSFHMYSHLRHYNEPLVQRKIVTILWMSPIYAVTSFFSLVFPVADGYLAVIKDFYEAYAIFTFLSFLIAVLGRGDRQVAIQGLSRHADHLQQPTRCLRSCYHPPPEQSDWAKANAVVTECQILAMQFVFVRPITSILGFVCTTLYEADDYYGDEYDDASSSYAYFKSPAFYISMITNISVFLAFGGLLKFYHAVRDDLAWCQPFSKFMTIKGIVFLTFWQGLLISIVVSSLNRNSNNTHSSQFVHSGTANAQSSSGHTSNSNNETSSMEEAAAIQNFLICLEMLFFSIAHYCVFPVEEWQPNYRPQVMEKPGIGIKDFVSDMSYIISTSRQRRKHHRLHKGLSSGSGGEHSQIPSFDSEFDDADADPEYEEDDFEEIGYNNDNPTDDDVLDPERDTSETTSRRRSTLQELRVEDRRDPLSYQQQGHHHELQ